VPRTLSREAIVGVARDLVIEEGLPAVSLRRVATSLGVTAPALYAHVTDKRDLLQCIADGEFQRLIEAFDAVVSDDPVDCIRKQAIVYVEYARDNPALFMTMFMYRPELTNERREGQSPLALQAYEAGSAPVRKAIQSGRFRPGNPRLTAHTVWAAVHGVASLIVSGPEPLSAADADELAHQVIDTMIRGLEA
jgi:AcrR family transcriptional regulator